MNREPTIRGTGRRQRLLAGIALVLLVVVSTACSKGHGHQASGPIHAGSFASVIPKPVSVQPATGSFVLDGSTEIVVESSAKEAGDAANLLRDELRPATSFSLDRKTKGSDSGPRPIVFTTRGADPSLGDEGYELRIRPDRLEIAARTATGFIWGVQTLRQLLAPQIESPRHQGGRWSVPAGVIRDQPRFAWRGYMLDVARRFVSLPDVERLVDLMSEYKLNRLHLHLTDDQGWRIQILSHPELTAIGAQPAVGGGGGFYTQAQYRDLVAYAAKRGVEVVPEIDMPGHATAALIALPSLACDGKAPPPHTTYGPSPYALCVDNPNTYTFVDDVVREVAGLTPGPYLHIGGDEAISVPAPAYDQFILRTAGIVKAHGKQPIGWDEVAKVDHSAGAIVQTWEVSATAPQTSVAGPGVIVSPANRAYLDMKYDQSSRVGTAWAGFVDTQAAYNWDPASAVPGLAGIERPWRRSRAVDRDRDDVRGRAVPHVAAPAWVRGVGVVASGGPELGRVQGAPRRSSPPLA